MNTDQELPARIEILPTHHYELWCDECAFCVHTRNYLRGDNWLKHHKLLVHVLAGRALKDVS